MVALVVVLPLILAMVVPVTPQSTTNGNEVIRSFCGRNPPIVLSNFLRNRNSTFSQLRSQISNNGVYYARAQDLQNSDSVYGTIQCRNYLSAAQCVACFDAAVSALIPCVTGNGAYVFFDNCYLRYANYEDFYSNPYVTEDVGIGTPLGICGNQSASQPDFIQTIGGLLSDLRVATPRTPNFYVTTTRQVASRNATVYAIAQCVQNISQSICQSCVNNGYTNLDNCLPNSEARSIDMACFMRYSETPFFLENQTIDITPFLGKGSSSKAGIIGGAVGGVGLVLLLVASFLWYRLRKKSKAVEEDESEFKGAVNYNYKDLQLATNNFSDENRIGKGGFGEVFKAMVDDENVVAVKKLQIGDGRAKKEFGNEVKLISNVRHRNLIRLLGWSSEGPELLLVLEYMPKGSLDRYLWGANNGRLSWKQRSDIIFGIARGLVHLHEEFHVKIVHRDIKSSNILLDDDFQPKIADFGLARFQPGDETHVSTKFAGTLGYTAPEYALRGQLSEKVDTYSFGIVVLEIVSGRRCTDVDSDGPVSDYLLEHAWKLYEKEMHMKFIDKALDRSEYEEEQVLKIIEIALTCTQSPASLRPTMSEVLLMLSSGRSFKGTQLTRPTFIDHERRIHLGSFQRTVGGTQKPQKPKGLDVNVESQGEVREVDVKEKGYNA